MVRQHKAEATCVCLQHMKTFVRDIHCIFSLVTERPFTAGVIRLLHI